MVEQREGLLLAAFDIESEGRARTGTLPVEHRLAGVALLEEAEIVHSRYLGVAREIFSDENAEELRGPIRRVLRTQDHSVRGPARTFKSADDVAWAMGVVAAGQQPKTGPASEVSVFEADVFRKQDGRWLYVSHAVSLLPPP